MMTRRELLRNSLFGAAAGGALLALGRLGLLETADAKPAPAHHFAVTHTDAEWKKLLTPAQYNVLRQAGTEPAFSGQYEAKGKGLLQVCRLQQRIVQHRHAVRLRDGLAELLEAADQKQRLAAVRRQPRHEPHRSGLRALRLAPGPCLRRRPEADRPALLHELGRDEVCRDEVCPEEVEGEPAGRQKAKNEGGISPPSFCRPSCLTPLHRWRHDDRDEYSWCPKRLHEFAGPPKLKKSFVVPQ